MYGSQINKVFVADGDALVMDLEHERSLVGEDILASTFIGLALIVAGLIIQQLKTGQA